VKKGDLTAGAVLIKLNTLDGQAEAFQLIIGQSDTRKVSWKPSRWKIIETHEFAYSVKWR